MDTITKKALVDKIAQDTGLKRVDVKKVVQHFLDEVVSEVGQGNRLEFRDFGVFEVKQRAPRMAQNPKTLERVPVPAKRTVKFKPGRRMRQLLEEPSKSNPNAAAHSRSAGETTPKTHEDPQIYVKAGTRADAVAAG